MIMEAAIRGANQEANARSRLVNRLFTVLHSPAADPAHHYSETGKALPYDNRHGDAKGASQGEGSWMFLECE